MLCPALQAAPWGLQPREWLLTAGWLEVQTSIPQWGGFSQPSKNGFGLFPTCLLRGEDLGLTAPRISTPSTSLGT